MQTCCDLSVEGSDVVSIAHTKPVARSGDFWSFSNAGEELHEQGHAERGEPGATGRRGGVQGHLPLQPLHEKSATAKAPTSIPHGVTSISLVFTRTLRVGAWRIMENLAGERLRSRG